MATTGDSIFAGVRSYAAADRKITRIPLHYPYPKRWWIAFAVTGFFVLVWLVSVVWLFWRGVGVWGIQMPVPWGFAISNYVWWIGMGHAGTLISALFLLINQGWRNSINRFAEAMTVFAVLMAGMYPILHLGRPWLFYWLIPYPNTMTVWPQFKSPLEWDLFAVSTYLIVSVLFFYIGLIPDLASVRDRARRRWVKMIYGVLALGWRGSARHWKRWQVAYWICAGLAVPLVVSVHSGVSLLFAVGLEPGWHSTLFPAYFVLGAVFEGFAVVTLIAISLRTIFGLEVMVTDRHLDILGKLVLATGLMTAYGYLFDSFHAWYSGDPYERGTLMDRLFGGYAWSFWATILCNVVAIQLLWFESMRRRTWLLFTIAALVTFGMWAERFMLLVTGLYRDFLTSSWQSYWPSFWDWSLFAGTIGLFLFLFLLFVRLVPMISIFEVAEAMREERADG
ncbi:MAG: polysulfide reductase NrfD [Geminicoccaceae bacterium]|nr:polysulfide reductase NrfD [Geminicoccaceae bacterium]